MVLAMMMVGELHTVLRTYVADGRLVCDLTRMGSGARYMTAVPVAQWGGGPLRGLVVPPTPAVRPVGGSAGTQFDPAVNEGAQVVVIYVQADPMTNPRPVIIGAIGHTSLGLSTATSQDNGAGDDADPTLDAQAIAILNAGASFVLDQRGDVAVTPAHSRSARVQLAAEGFFRVSRDGAASDYAVLAQPMVDAFNVLLAEVAELRSSLAATMLAVNTLAAPATPLIPISPVEPVPDLAVNDIAADALRVSSDTPQS